MLDSEGPSVRGANMTLDWFRRSGEVCTTEGCDT